MSAPPTGYEDPSTGACPVREDGRHCEHWWDGDGPCCSCGFDGELMNEEPPEPHEVRPKTAKVDLERVRSLCARAQRALPLTPEDDAFLREALAADPEGYRRAHADAWNENAAALGSRTRRGS